MGDAGLAQPACLECDGHMGWLTGECRLCEDGGQPPVEGLKSCSASLPPTIVLVAIPSRHKGLKVSAGPPGLTVDGDEQALRNLVFAMAACPHRSLTSGF